MIQQVVSGKIETDDARCLQLLFAICEDVCLLLSMISDMIINNWYY